MTEEDDGESPGDTLGGSLGEEAKVVDLLTETSVGDCVSDSKGSTIGAGTDLKEVDCLPSLDNGLRSTAHLNTELECTSSTQLSELELSSPMMKSAPLCRGDNSRSSRLEWRISRLQSLVAIHTDASTIAVQPLLTAAGTK